jgi:hypothetical protein
MDRNIFDLTVDLILRARYVFPQKPPDLLLTGKLVKLTQKDFVIFFHSCVTEVLQFRFWSCVPDDFAKQRRA